MEKIVGLNGWKKARMDVFWGEIAPCDHVLQVYENDEAFIDTLEGFITSGFRAGESVIIIATEKHLEALSVKLRSKGYDLFSMSLTDQYIPVIVDDALGQFMINGWPDENLFYYMLTNLLLRARKGGRHVRAFGEMVAVLWSKGYSGATVHLEYLWNRFCKSEQFSLFCAYPRSGFTEDAHESLAKICQCHSTLIAPSAKDPSEILVKNVASKHPDR